MIRIHLVMILALAQAIFAERLVVTFATGGRGVISFTNLIDPWVSLILVFIPFRGELKKAIWTKHFLLFWMPFLGFTFVLPILGVVFNEFPVRSLYASWNAIIPFAFLAFGSVGVFQIKGSGVVIRVYFMFAILIQLGLTLVQTMGQFEYLPGFLRYIYEWDFHFKEIYLPDNIILGRATGFYLNPNSLGIWAILAMWTSFLLLKGKERVVGVTASFITILLCQSRGTMAAFLGSGAVYGLVWMILRANRRQRHKAMLLTMACAFPILILTIPGMADSMMGGLKDLPVFGRAIERYVSGAKVLSHGAAADANFQGRTEYWQAAYTYLKNHPFGTLGSPEMVIKVPPDNQYIAALEQGSFFFLGALVLAFLGGIRLFNSPDAHARLLAVATLSLVINGITAVPFAYPAAFIYWLLVGVYLARRVEHQEPSPPAEVSP